MCFSNSPMLQSITLVSNSVLHRVPCPGEGFTQPEHHVHVVSIQYLCVGCSQMDVRLLELLVGHWLSGAVCINLPQHHSVHLKTKVCLSSMFECDFTIKVVSGNRHDLLYISADGDNYQTLLMTLEYMNQGPCFNNYLICLSFNRFLYESRPLIHIL